MISISNLSKHYGNVVAVDDLSLSIEPGEVFGFIGSNGAGKTTTIEILEGLEPVRRHPGMYIGGTDERALHHLAAEVLDNAMDEVVAGHADRSDVWS